MYRFRSSKVYHLRSRTSATTTSHVTSPYDHEKNTRALEALLLAILTACPYSTQPSIVNPAAETDLLGAEFSHYVACALTLSYMSDNTLIYPPSPHHQAAAFIQSSNISWLRAVLASGYPAALVAKLLTEKKDPIWENTEEARLLYRLVSYTGFIPIPVDEADDTAQPPPEYQDRRQRGRRTPGATAQHTPTQAQRSSTRQQPAPPPTNSVLNMDCEAQRSRIHILARMRAYELDYLSRRRHWGPFRPVSPAASDAHAKLESTMARGNPAPLDDDDSDDSEFVPLAVEDESDADSDTSSRESTPAPEPRRTGRPVPTSAELVPDWAWLASARIVADANLAALTTDVNGDTITDIGGLHDWNGLREGTWSREPDSDNDGKLKLKDSRNVSGWDWAGAEGMWR